MDPALPERLEAVRARIGDAAREAGREPDDVTLIVVTKFQPLALIRDLVDLGVRDFGESRHPEARDKALAVPDARWHFVGQLQTNKARQVARYAAAVHSVDRSGLVEALARRMQEPRAADGERFEERDAVRGRIEDAADARPRDLDVFLQVDLGPEVQPEGRGGAAPADAERLAERILAADGLRLLGVMAVAPVDEEPARAFARLRDVSDRIRTLDPAASAVSAGMSGDFVPAIGVGATHLRIGTAITGPRP